MNLDVGKVLFNLQRFQILQTKSNPQTSDLIPDYYAYAWEVKLFPALDENALHEDLKEYFTIKEKQVNLISDRADSEWLEKRLYNFYEYEDYFRKDTQNGIDRVTLLYSFRYFYLKRGFDDSFWEKLLEPSKHPSEAALIKRDFKIDSIYLI
jgi:hypothetical protein